MSHVVLLGNKLVCKQDKKKKERKALPFKIWFVYYFIKTNLRSNWLMIKLNFLSYSSFFDYVCVLLSLVIV